jgi:hypothetical protein
MLVQVYTEKCTPRCEYAIDLVLNTVLGLEYKLFTDENLLDFQAPVINYSNKKLNTLIQIVPHTILFEEDIKTQDIEVEAYSFFRTSQGTLPFDYFASAFYMASRYEEYLPSELDSHGRYKAENTLAYRNGFLNKAVVHHWTNQLKNVLKQYYSDLKFNPSEYAYLSTIDIDSAYAYKAKGLKRLLGGFAKALLRKDFEDIKHRFSYLFLGSKDPFDVYDSFDYLHNRDNIQSKYFFLVGKNGPFDKNIQISKKPLQNLIKGINAANPIGIHPSYQSNSNIKILQDEKEQLALVSKSVISSSRQHFLKLKFPDTYQNLIESGIKHDYSMGFASQLGFRAGLCLPYKYFDLSSNSKTELTIVPFQIMDGTLNQYLSLSQEDAWEKVMDIYKEVKSVNGLLVTLWHNESLSEMRNWKNWRAFYERMIKEINN